MAISARTDGLLTVRNCRSNGLATWLGCCGRSRHRPVRGRSLCLATGMLLASRCIGPRCDGAAGDPELPTGGTAVLADDHRGLPYSNVPKLFRSFHRTRTALEVGRTFLPDQREPPLQAPDKNVRPTSEFVPTNTMQGALTWWCSSGTDGGNRALGEFRQRYRRLLLDLRVVVSSGSVMRSVQEDSRHYPMFRHRSATPAGVTGNGVVRSLGDNVASIERSAGNA